MLEWIESSSVDSKTFANLVERLPAYSVDGRIQQWVRTEQLRFPKSQFEISQGSPAIRGGESWSRYFLSATFDHRDLHEKAPKWLVDSEDYYWVWNDLAESFKASLIKLKIPMNYFKENRDRQCWVMRSYDLSSRTPLCPQSIYQFELKVLDASLDSPGRGIQLKTELLVPPKSLIYFEKVSALFDLWLTSP